MNEELSIEERARIARAEWDVWFAKQKKIHDRLDLIAGIGVFVLLMLFDAIADDWFPGYLW